MAASRSERAVEAPCIGVPPVMEIFVEAVEVFGPGPGVEDREAGFERGFVFGASRSEVRMPADDNLGFDVPGADTAAGGGFD